MAIACWSLMNLNHMEGGRRLVKAIRDTGLIDRVFQNDCRLQHSGTFGMSLVGLVPDQVDLLAQVGVVWGVASRATARLPGLGHAPELAECISPTL